MKRTAEKTLSIIASVLNLLSIIGVVIAVFFGQMIVNDPFFEAELYNEFMIDPEFTAEEAEFITQFMLALFKGIGIIGWLTAIALFIAMILSIIAVFKVDKNAKAAGIMLLIAFVFSGFLSIQAILLLIASLMCFMKKPKTAPQPVVAAETANHVADSEIASTSDVSTSENTTD